MVQSPAQSLRILLALEPGLDGVFRHVESLAHFLVAHGQQVHLAYSDRRGSPELLRLADFVREQGGETLNLKVSNAPGPSDISALHRLRGLAGRVQPQVIHSHSSKAGVLGRTLALLGVKAAQFYTPHAYYGMAPRPGLKNHLYNQIESRCAAIGQTIHISEDERDFAVQTLRVPLEKSLLIPNAIDTDFFVPPTPSEKARVQNEFGLPADVPILGAMGRLSFQKDPQTLYLAFAHALELGNSCHLLHVGQGEDSAQLAKFAGALGIEKNLTRIAYLREPIKFYHAIDSLILTSRYEGCPLVALEALSCDLPLVLSDAPGTRWLGRSGLSHCWTAPVQDDEAFARGISDWLEDRPRNRASNHRAFAVEKFNREKLFGKILGAYRAAAKIAP